MTSEYVISICDEILSDPNALYKEGNRFGIHVTTTESAPSLGGIVEWLEDNKNIKSKYFVRYQYTLTCAKKVLLSLIREHAVRPIEPEVKSGARQVYNINKDNKGKVIKNLEFLLSHICFDPVTLKPGKLVKTEEKKSPRYLVNLTEPAMYEIHLEGADDFCLSKAPLSPHK